MNAAPKPPSPATGRQRFRFLSIFGAIIGGYYLLTAIPWVDAHLILPVLKFSAQCSSALLDWGGWSTVREGVVIRGPSFAIAVRRGCDPLEPIALFGAGVLAFPAGSRQRAIGLGVGAILLFLINVLRITSLYVLGARGGKAFETVHQEWWPALFILAALGLWVLWLMWVQKSAPRDHA